MLSRNLLTKIVISLFLLGGLVASCRKVHIYKGKVTIEERVIDTSLHDSVLFWGNVVSAEENSRPEPFAKVWIDSNIRYTSNRNGMFEFKTVRGIYIVCGQSEYGGIVEKSEPIIVLANEKIKLKISIGITIE